MERTDVAPEGRDVVPVWIREDQLAFHQVRAGESAALVEKVQAFVTRLASDKLPVPGHRDQGATDASP